MAIRLADARNYKGKRVSYQTVSGDRPWLTRAKDIRLTGQVATNSASVQVEFTYEDGNKDVAWVGASALTLIENKHQSSIDALTAERDEHLKQAAGLDAAIKALESLS